jgi:transcription elongation factor GreA
MMKDKLTESDIKKMKEEIEYRKVTLRPQLLEHVKTARAHGDLSENFEYKAAKQEKNRNESRIRYLERMIKSAVIIDDSSKDDEVGINNTVTVVYEGEEDEEKIKIVTTVRSDSINGLISIESPLGKALIGHKVGDRVHVVVDENIEYDVEIRDIDKTTDDSLDKIAEY